ncbi:MAG: hypothetical protein KF794_02310 [Xanthobacteraceae bacterium]|nr:hypothetical protein [Xanthobacteraceae bacterium]QYK45559.1 MAG: hypothetical protein KF794_02310 [Xanthobacteraceae bacterium]
MNVFSWFFAGMIAVGVTVAVVLKIWPHFNAFDFMPYVTIFACMGVLELGVMFTGKLTGPMPLNIRFIALALGIAAYLFVSYTLPLVAGG